MILNNSFGQKPIVTSECDIYIVTAPFPIYTSLIDNTESNLYFMSNDGGTLNIILNQISTSGKKNGLIYLYFNILDIDGSIIKSTKYISTLVSNSDHPIIWDNTYSYIYFGSKQSGTIYICRASVSTPSNCKCGECIIYA